MQTGCKREEGHGKLLKFMVKMGTNKKKPCDWSRSCDLFYLLYSKKKKKKSELSKFQIRFFFSHISNFKLE